MFVVGNVGLMTIIWFVIMFVFCYGLVPFAMGFYLLGLGCCGMLLDMVPGILILML